MQASSEELEDYIETYDKNGDKTINFEEFKIIMQDKILSEFMSTENIKEDLKKEFKKIDTKKENKINIVQFYQVLSNFGV